MWPMRGVVVANCTIRLWKTTISFCREARMNNDESVDRAIHLKCENQVDWWSTYGDGPANTDDDVTRLSDRK